MHLRNSFALFFFTTFATAQTLSLVSGDGQLLPYGSGVGSQPIVFAVMSGSTPVANQTINFTNSNGSAATSLIPQSIVTNSAGTATVIFYPAYNNGNVYQGFTLQAHYGSQVVQFHESSAQVPPTQLLLTAPIQTALEPLIAKAGQAGTPIKVTIDASFQGPISNIAVRLIPITTSNAIPPGTVTQTATCAEAGSTPQGQVFTNTSGVATCTPVFTYPNAALNPLYDTFTFKIGIGGSFSFGPFSYSITPVPLTINGPRGVILQKGDPSTIQITGAGGVPPYTFALASNSGLLPGGLSLAADGQIQGSSNTPGLFPFLVFMKDHTGAVLTSPAYSIAISGGPFVGSPQSIPDAVVGQPYAQSISISGGVPPYTLSIGGTLAPGLLASTDPSGLSLKISGTPSAPSNASLGIKINDTVGNPGVISLLGFQVVSPVSIAKVNTQLAVGSAPFQFPVPITGGLPPYNVVATGLPLGLSINATGLIFGIPSGKDGVYTVGVTVTDTLNLGASTTFTLDLSGGVLGLGASTFPAEQAGVLFSQPLSISGGVPPYAFTVASSPGQNLSISSDGILTGSIANVGTEVVAFSVTDSANSSKPFTIMIPVQPAITAGGIGNSASFVGGLIAPGEIVSIFGAGLGPNTPVGPTLTSNNLISTVDGNTEVHFGAFAAPILYASATQLNVIVPFEVTPGQSIPVTVTSNSQTSLPLNITATEAFPGIFIIGGTNSPQQAAVLNQDLSLNGPANPAKSGGIIVVYATGGGVLSAPVTDGELPGTLINVANASLTVGGQPATIVFAGLAPGLAGMLQINATLPTGIAPGPAVPIVLSISGADSSKQSATVAIQ